MSHNRVRVGLSDSSDENDYENDVVPFTPPDGLYLGCATVLYGCHVVDDRLTVSRVVYERHCDLQEVLDKMPSYILPSTMPAWVSIFEYVFMNKTPDSERITDIKAVMVSECGLTSARSSLLALQMLDETYTPDVKHSPPSHLISFDNWSRSRMVTLF